MARKSHFHEGLWGLACKDGKLYEFSDSHVLVMKGWPDPRAWFKRRSHGWKPTRKWADVLLSQPAFIDKTPAPAKPTQPFALPNGQMILTGVVIPEERRARREYSDHVARTAFIDMIPETIRLELQRYSNRRWHLLNILARCPNSLDLSRSNPALLFALASNWAFHKPAVAKPIRAVRRLIGKKEKVIQEWLGFPATEAVRKLLAKIEPDAVNVEALLYLREALQNPVCLKLLRHLPRLNRQVVMLASDRRLMDHVTPRLLQDVISRSTQMTPDDETFESQDVYRLMLDTVRMATIVDWEKCPQKFCSLKRLQAIHDELSPRMDAALLKKKYNLPDKFGEPPFPGTEHIVPIRTPEEMFREGYLQKNCVGSYVLPVAEGAEYVYRVEQPIRATLSVVLKSGAWEPSQLFKGCNVPVDPETKRQIFGELFKTRRPVAPRSD